MEKHEIEKLRDLPIEGVAERLGLPVSRHKTLCPFHDDHHPSMSFSVSRNTFRCFVCGAAGDTITLVMRRLGKDFRDACQWLADEHCVIITSQPPSAPLSTRREAGGEAFSASRYARYFEHPWLSDAARRFLYDERRIDPRVVRWCRLTSWTDKQGTPWLQTPYYNSEGQLVGIQNRNLAYGSTLHAHPSTLNPHPSTLNTHPSTLHAQPSTLNTHPSTLHAPPNPPRFRFPAGSQCGIYNLPVLNLLRDGEALYIAEGCSDCWSLLSAGHKAIAIPSATLLSQRDKQLLSALHAQRSTEFHMYPDNDVPGERLFLQLREVLPRLERHPLPPGCKDFSEYYLAAGHPRRPRPPSTPSLTFIHGVLDSQNNGFDGLNGFSLPAGPVGRIT